MKIHLILFLLFTSNVFCQVSNIKKSIELYANGKYKECISSLVSTNLEKIDIENKITIHYLIGLSKKQINDSTFFENYSKIVDLYDKINDKNYLKKSYSKIGFAFSKTGDLNSARYLYKSAYYFKKKQFDDEQLYDYSLTSLKNNYYNQSHKLLSKLKRKKNFKPKIDSLLNKTKFEKENPILKDFNKSNKIEVEILSYNCYNSFKINSVITKNGTKFLIQSRLKESSRKLVTEKKIKEFYISQEKIDSIVVLEKDLRNIVEYKSLGGIAGSGEQIKIKSNSREFNIEKNSIGSGLLMRLILTDITLEEYLNQ